MFVILAPSRLQLGGCLGFLQADPILRTGSPEVVASPMGSRSIRLCGRGIFEQSASTSWINEIFRSMSACHMLNSSNLALPILSSLRNERTTFWSFHMMSGQLGYSKDSGPEVIFEGWIKIRVNLRARSPQCFRNINAVRHKLFKELCDVAELLDSTISPPHHPNKGPVR